MADGLADALLVVALVGVVLLGVLVVAQGRALRRHRRRYRAAFAGTDATSLLDAVRQQADELDELRAALDAVRVPEDTTPAVDDLVVAASPGGAATDTTAEESSGDADTAETGRPAVERMAVVRYDAFPSTNGSGPSLSFSLALLDEQLDGVVLTGITGRNESRVYCKAVEDGRSEQNLSDEEMAAIDAAASDERVVLAGPASSLEGGARRTLRRRTA